MDAGNTVENARARLAWYKAETSHMARYLRAKKLAIKWTKKEVRRIKRLNQLIIEFNKRTDEMVEKFLVRAEAENNNNDLETANMWSEAAVEEVIQGINVLNLDGGNSIISAVEQDISADV